MILLRTTLEMIAYLADKLGRKEVNKMKLLKLLWLTDRLHAQRYGSTITGDTYVAMKNGPVLSETYDLLKGTVYQTESKEYLSQSSDKYNIKIHAKPNIDELAETEIEVADEVIGYFGNLDGFGLSNISHDFPEWKEHESDLVEKSINQAAIDINKFMLADVKNSIPLFFDVPKDSSVYSHFIINNALMR